MTALIVASAILLLFIVILFSPIILRVIYDGANFKVKFRYTLIAFSFSGDDLKDDAEAEKPIEEEVKQEQDKEAKPQKKQSRRKLLIKLAKQFYPLLISVKRATALIIRHLVFYKVKAKVIVGGDDAAEVGDNYSKICVAVSGLLAAIGAAFTLKPPDINISANFALPKTQTSFDFRVRILPIFPIMAGIIVAITFLKIYFKKPKRRRKRKGGKRHECTTSAK